MVATRSILHEDLIHQSGLEIQHRFISLGQKRNL